MNFVYIHWICIQYCYRRILLGSNIWLFCKTIGPQIQICQGMFDTINILTSTKRSSALDSSSGVVRMRVRILAWLVVALVSLSKTLYHNCFVLRMGRKAVGPVCCVMHVTEPRTLIVKEKGLAPVFLDSRLEHPAGWICTRYKSSVLLLVWQRGWVSM